MKKILITGSSGFIGSFLVEEALSRNYVVHAGVRRTSSKKYLSDKRINFFEMDLEKPENTYDHLHEFTNSEGPFDYIIHNAGLKQALNKRDYSFINFECTKDFIDAVTNAHSIKQKFLFMSSIAAYGPGRGTSPIRISDNPKPISSYGKSKLKAEKYIKSSSDLQYIILRPTSVYGPRETGLFNFIKLINLGLELYIGTKTQYLSLIYVKDLARVVFEILESDYSNKEYFISDGEMYANYTFGNTIKKILAKRTIKINVPFPVADIFAYASEKIASLNGKTSPLNTDKVKELKSRNWVCDISEISKDLNFSHEYDLEKGLGETIAWYKKAGWLK